MAKLSKTASSASVKAAADVRRVRDRFMRALQLGYTTGEAAAMAKGSGPMQPKIREPDPVRVERPRQSSGITPRVDTVTISGQPPVTEATQPEDQPAEIPPTWVDLPYPQLRELAQKVTGRVIRSRADATKAIQDHLAGTGTQQEI